MEASSKLKMKQPPATGQETYQYLTIVWQQGNKCTFKDLLRRYNNKEVVPTLEAMQKMVGFYHNKRIDMLKLGRTLTNFEKFCLHKSTNATFFPFTETDKIGEDMVGGPSIVFTGKAVVDETFFRDSTNWCKYIVGIDCSQLYPFLYASSNANWSVHEMGARFGI